MPNNKGNIVLPIISAIAVLALVAAGYFFWKSQQPRGEALGPYTPPTSTNNPPPSPNDETANWKTISNPDYKYSFKIPPSWMPSELSSNFPQISEFSAPDKSRIRIESYSTEGKNLTEYLKESDKIAQISYEGTPSKITQSSKEISVGGQKAIQRKEDWPAAGFNTIVLYVKSGDNIYIISVLPYAKPPMTLIQMEAFKLFDQILSTFKFTNQNSVNNQTSTVKVFFNNKKLANDPQMLDCGKVFAVNRTIPQTKAVATAAITQWLKGPTTDEQLKGYTGGTKNGEVVLNKITITNGEAIVDLHFQKNADGGTTVRNYLAGSCGIESFVSQIKSTVKQFPTVKNVQIAIDGSVSEFNSWASNP